MRRRSWELAAYGLCVICSGCSQDGSRPELDNRTTADRVSVQSSSRNTPRPEREPEPDSVEPSANHSHVSEPEATDKCEFEEHDPADRPTDFVAANFRSNVIFYQRPGGSLWSHVYADGRAIAEVMKGELFVAARFGKPDLWIRVIGEGVTLEAGPYRLTCY